MLALGAFNLMRKRSYSLFNQSTNHQNEVNAEGNELTAIQALYYFYQF